MREISRIVLHHSATSGDATVSEIRAMHLARGYTDIGYHVLVDPAGVVIEGRPLARMGAHAAGANVGTIGVCLIGRFDGGGPPPPAAQWEAALHIVAVLCARFMLLVGDVRGHCEVGTTPTVCPGYDPEQFRLALSELLEASCDKPSLPC